MSDRVRFMRVFFLQDFCGILKKIVQDLKKTDFRDFLGNPARLCYFRSGSTARDRPLSSPLYSSLPWLSFLSYSFHPIHAMATDDEWHSVYHPITTTVAWERCRAAASLADWFKGPKRLCDFYVLCQFTRVFLLSGSYVLQFSWPSLSRSASPL
jgi:hypothetical protein